MTNRTPQPGSASAADQLHAEVDHLFDLNPDRAQLGLERMLCLAADCSAGRFAEFAERAGQLIEVYLQTPWKAAGRGTLRQYFAALENSARRMVERGDVSSGVIEEGKAEAGESATGFPAALSSARNPGSLEWGRVLQEARIPQPLEAAVDAYRNRASRVSGVVEVMFCILQQIDREAAFRWQMDFLRDCRERLDPEIARDLLRAWDKAQPLPPEALEQVLAWSTDAGLLHEWPSVSRQADALLQKTALQLLASQPVPINSQLHTLHALAGASPSYRDLQRWLDAAMRSLGETIDFFVRTAERGKESTQGHGGPHADWSRAAVIRELESIENLYPHLLLLSDILLRTPDGAANFAYAIFGFTEEGWRRWQEQLLASARQAVTRLFLRNLREKRSVVPIIQRLSFGDEKLVMKLKGHVDLVAGQFLSIKARDAAAMELAPYYASYREQEMLAKETTRRYRRLMRVLHVDNLNRILGDRAARFVDSSVLRDLSSLAAGARAYLNQRRALHAPLEETLATEADFNHSIRFQRAAAIRRMAQNEGGSC